MIGIQFIMACKWECVIIGYLFVYGFFSFIWEIRILCGILGFASSYAYAWFSYCLAVYNLKFHKYHSAV